MSRLDQGLRLVQVLGMPGAWGSLRHARPFSSSAFLIARDLRAGCGPFRTVIDAGANAGQFSVAMARENPEATILALEPLPDVAARLRENVAGLGRVHVHEVAAGAVPGRSRIHRHQYTLSSSLLPTTADFSAVFPGAAGQGEPEPIDVEVARLDDVVDLDALAEPVLLKLDVQGFEIEALRGAERLLERCRHVLAETALERVYSGEPLFGELQEHLRERGFEFERPVDFLRGARGTISQMDVLFSRRDRS